MTIKRIDHNQALELALEARAADEIGAHDLTLYLRAEYDVIFTEIEKCLPQK